MTSPAHSAHRIILGTVQLGLKYGINNEQGQPSEEQATAILDAAKRAGINKLDTADGYGTSQKLIGKYQKASGSFEIFSKFTFQPGQELIAACLENSLQELNMGKIEGYSFHRFKDFQAYNNSRELQGLKGKVRYIGASIYSNEELALAIESDFIEVIQLPFNLLDSSPEKRALLRKAKERKKILHARSLFLQGLFFMEERAVPAKLRPLLPYLAQLRKIAEECALSMGGLALLYALAENSLDAVLIGVETAAQLEGGMQALKHEPLAQHVIGKIQALNVKEKELLSPANW